MDEYETIEELETLIADMAFMLHNLPTPEADKLGAALCKDIINNYKGHVVNLKDKITDLENGDREMRYRNTELQNRNAELCRLIANWKENADSADNAVGELRHTNKMLRAEARVMENASEELCNTIEKMKKVHFNRKAHIHNLEEDIVVLMEERDEYKETLAIERIDGETEKITTGAHYCSVIRKKDAAIKELEHTTLGHYKVHASIVAGLLLQIGDLRAHVREHNTTMNDCIVEHNKQRI